VRWAFSDESRRGALYVIAAVIVETHDVNDVRSELRAFLRPNQRRVHMVKESAARRAQFLALVDALPAVRIAVRCSIATTSLRKARVVLLDALTGVMVEHRVESWRLEWMGPSQERLDRQAIGRALLRLDHEGEFLYDHMAPHADPLLWAADAVAWAASRPRAQGVEVVDIDPGRATPG
jgi:hypothetical protein